MTCLDKLSYADNLCAALLCKRSFILFYVFMLLIDIFHGALIAIDAFEATVDNHQKNGQAQIQHGGKDEEGAGESLDRALVHETIDGAGH